MALIALQKAVWKTADTGSPQKPVSVGSAMTRRKIQTRLALPPILAWIAAVAFGAAAIAHAADKPKQTQDATAKRYERVTDPSLYVGAETCKTCHEDIFKNFETTPHFVTTLANKRGPEWQSCEACHGPGKEHVEGGGDKTKIFTFKGVSAEASSARCLDCHSYGQEHFCPVGASAK